MATAAVVIHVTTDFDPNEFSSIVDVGAELLGIFGSVKEAKKFAHTMQNSMGGFFKVLPLNKEVHLGQWGHSE